MLSRGKSITGDDLYVYCTLPDKDQKEIALKLRNKLIAEGYSENEITQAVKDG
jgi:hypothetical protein